MEELLKNYNENVALLFKHLEDIETIIIKQAKILKELGYEDINCYFEC